jgi:hypothetical protein
MAKTMSDSHEKTLRRQTEGQRYLEDSMNRQEPMTKRDEQLKTLEEWLNKQLK